MGYKMKLTPSIFAMRERILSIAVVLASSICAKDALSAEGHPWIGGLGNVKLTRASDDFHARRSTVAIDINPLIESTHSRLSYSDIFFEQLDQKRYGYSINYLTDYMNNDSETFFIFGIEQVSGHALLAGQARHRWKIQSDSTLEIGASRGRVETIRSIDENVTLIEYGVDVEHRIMEKMTATLGATKIHFSDENTRNQYRAGLIFDLSRNTGTSIQLRRKQYSNSNQESYSYFNPHRFSEDSVIFTTSLSVSESIIRLKGSKGFQRVDQRSKTPTYSLEIGALTRLTPDLKVIWGLTRSRIESFGGEAYTASGIHVGVSLPLR